MTHQQSANLPTSTQDTQTATTPLMGFLRLPQVLALIPVSKSTWWEGCRTGRFPKPIKLTPRTTVWRVEDINEFITKMGKIKNGGEE